MDGKSPLLWVWWKQDVTALPLTEAEYIAVSSFAQNARWFRRILAFIGKPKIVPYVWTDDRGAAVLSNNLDFHKRTKHIRRRHSFLTECVGEGDLEFRWIMGEENPADMLTKPVPAAHFFKLMGLPGMISTIPLKQTLSSNIRSGRSITTVPQPFPLGQGNTATTGSTTLASTAIRTKPVGTTLTSAPGGSQTKKFLISASK